MSVTPERTPDLAVQLETRGIGRVRDVAAILRSRPVSRRGRTAPAVRAETEFVNKVPAQSSVGLGDAEWVADPETGEPIGRTRTAGTKVRDAFLDWGRCWRGHSIIGGAIVSAYAGPQAGQAVTQISLGAKGALCPRYGREGEPHALGKQLGIRREDAFKLLREGKYFFDPGEGVFVRSTTWRRFKAAARPYVPYIALGAGLLAVLVASSGNK